MWVFQIFVPSHGLLHTYTSETEAKAAYAVLHRAFPTDLLQYWKFEAVTGFWKMNESQPAKL